MGSRRNISRKNRVGANLKKRRAEERGKKLTEKNSTPQTTIGDTDLSNYDLTIESASSSQGTNSVAVEGRRFVDFENFTMVHEKFEGFRSAIKYKCEMCNFEKTIYTENPKLKDKPDVNVSATMAIMGLGGGVSNMKQFSYYMNMPCMNERTYFNKQAEVSKTYEKVGLSETKAAAEEEYAEAVRRGHVDKDGVPLITVIVDGAYGQHLKKKQEGRIDLEKRTRDQSKSAEWKGERKFYDTCSMFGRICKMKLHTSSKGVLKEILYTNLESEALTYGNEQEEYARDALASVLGMKIERCGMFIHPEISYLAGSPDGIAEDGGVVELKCHKNAEFMTPDEAIERRVSTFWNYSKKTGIGGVNTNHNHYYQIQGQMRALIIGQFTNKVLYMGVKNKYCSRCDYRASKNLQSCTTDHACYKNWDNSRSASSMESTIIAEGFCASEEMYGLKYNRMLGDGDCSVHKKLLELKPYKNIDVEKIECKNHLLRNYCKNIREYIKIGGPNAPPVGLRKIDGSKMKKIRSAVTHKAIVFRKNEDCTYETKISRLRFDIINSIHHVFGDHEKCSDYYCSGQKDGESNIVPDLKTGGLFQKLKSFNLMLAKNFRSLILDVH
ncbi:hypothetical protein B566_EDAN018063, partial [Ephemera danica]